MNIVVLKGNLTRDPEVREIETGAGRKTKVANFTIAVSRFFNKANGERDKSTTFIPCEAWDTGATSIEKLLKKGDPVLVNGAIKIETWETDSGDKRSRTKVRVSNFDKLYRASKPSNGDVPQESTEVSNDVPAETPVDAGAPVVVDGIPF